MSKLKLGWLGLGNMGIPMAQNLLKAGFDLTVFNRTKDKEKELIDAGASRAGSAAQLLEDCEVVLTMLSDDAAVKEVFNGASGLLSKRQQGKLIINMSTVSPETSAFLAESCLQHGVGFLEAPVSGSVKPAQEGQLIILVGGSEADYLKASPVFEVLGKRSLHLGAVGVGTSAKLAINYLLGLNLQGLAETILFAQNQGVKTADMLTIINEGACGNGVTKLKGASILKNEYPAAFALKHLEKDLRLARATGLNAPLMKPLYESFERAKQEGLGEEDVMAIIKSLDKKQQ